MYPYPYPGYYAARGPAPYYSLEFQYPCYRQFPPVDIKGLTYSARQFQRLMEQASLLINKIIQSNSFAFDLMNAAQQSNQQKVDELIHATGISIDVKTKFTPSGIQITLDNSEMEGGCCKLLIALRW